MNEKITAFAKDKMYAIASAASAKHERRDAFDALANEVNEYLGEELPDEDKALIDYYFGELQYHVVRDMILDDWKRLDGRGLEDIRRLPWKQIFFLLHMVLHYLQEVKHNHLQQLL